MIGLQRGLLPLHNDFERLQVGQIVSCAACCRRSRPMAAGKLSGPAPPKSTSPRHLPSGGSQPLPQTPIVPNAHGHSWRAILTAVASSLGRILLINLYWFVLQLGASNRCCVTTLLATSACAKLQRVSHSAEV
jgi:hypothetical protein